MVARYSYGESALQAGCVSWFRYRYPGLRHSFFSVPNGGARSAVTGRILKAEGSLAGVSDLILLAAHGGWHGLCIEMKTAHGRQQDSQRAFESACAAQGYKYAVCRSLKEFMAEVRSYLDSPRTEGGHPDAGR